MLRWSVREGFVAFRTRLRRRLDESHGQRLLLWAVMNAPLPGPSRQKPPVPHPLLEDDRP